MLASCLWPDGALYMVYSTSLSSIEGYIVGHQPCQTLLLVSDHDRELELPTIKLDIVHWLETKLFIKTESSF